MYFIFELGLGYLALASNLAARHLFICFVYDPHLRDSNAAQRRLPTKARIARKATLMYAWMYLYSPGIAK